MWQKFKDKVSKAYAKFWLWCKNSGSILIARLEVFGGIVISAISAFDWSPLVALGSDAAFSLKQGIYLGSVMFVKGVMTEWVRRRNDPYLTLKTAVVSNEVTKEDTEVAKQEVIQTVKAVP